MHACMLNCRWFYLVGNMIVISYIRWIFEAMTFFPSYFKYEKIRFNDKPQYVVHTEHHILTNGKSLTSMLNNLMSYLRLTALTHIMLLILLHNENQK